MRRLAVVCCLLSLCLSPICAQRFCVVEQDVTLVPVQFLPEALRADIGPDTPGRGVVAGTDCVALRQYAEHIGASVGWVASERQAQLILGDQVLTFWALAADEFQWALAGLVLPPPPTTAHQWEVIESTCARVIDGDTIELTTGQRVQYIGVSALEPLPPEAPLNPLAVAAARVNAGLVADLPVRVLLGEEQRENQSALLGYVFVGDLFVNAVMVNSGLARVTSSAPNAIYSVYLFGLNSAARAAGRGLWQPVPQPTSATSSQTSGSGTQSSSTPAQTQGNCPRGGDHTPGTRDRNGRLHCAKCGRFM